MIALDIKSKADIRLFTYYFINGTLDFDLLNNQLKTNHIDYIKENPILFFEAYCVFANHKNRTPDLNPMNRRVAEYLCKTIDIDHFRHFDNFEEWELSFDIEGNSFASCLKDFAYRIAFDKIGSLSSTNNRFKDCITYGATFWETVFVIWANNLQIENTKVINQAYSIGRACQWFENPKKIEAWEMKLEQ